MRGLGLRGWAPCLPSTSHSPPTCGPSSPVISRLRQATRRGGSRAPAPVATRRRGLCSWAKRQPCLLLTRRRGGRGRTGEVRGAGAYCSSTPFLPFLHQHRQLLGALSKEPELCGGSGEDTPRGSAASATSGARAGSGLNATTPACPRAGPAVWRGVETQGPADQGCRQLAELVMDSQPCVCARVCVCTWARVHECISERGGDFHMLTDAQSLTQMPTDVHASGKPQCIILTPQSNFSSAFFWKVSGL